MTPGSPRLMAERTPTTTPPGIELPELVWRHLERSLPEHRPVPQEVCITQEGQMWQKPGGRASGEALRYLAELPWAPYAMAHNPQLEWRQLGERHVEVATHVRGDRLTVEMTAGENGDIVRSSSQMSLFQVGKEWVPTPWTGEFNHYQLLGGIRIPTRAEVYWDLPSGRFVYWRGRVVSAALLDRRDTG